MLNPEGKAGVGGPKRSSDEDKLDVRINSDGTCGVPGLIETPVSNVEDVLKCIGAART